MSLGSTGRVDELHPLLAHHIVNSLGWPSLHPLQRSAIEPISSGSHTLLVAPTAGGKTEAALFPVLSRMLEDDWPPLSVLYLCPLRALLNNLHPRIEQYATLIGRQAGLWHGDVGESAREAIRNEPPDVLLTTPESIEAMLISRKSDHVRMFRNLRTVIVDEIHAFAGDDRGWHLVAVTERLQHLVGRQLQRIGLSATVGNADEILSWLTRTCEGPRTVLAPSADATALSPEVVIDHVGNLGNAATVISRLHRGEKRLVFVDSRARTEELAAALRDLGVETYVSHGSLGREERRAAEEAFSTGRDCVIVATSTLELGIDVGDLDRIIQIDAPNSVASFLQRLGRTGRRPGRGSNTLFLTTRDDAFLQALGLLRCWEDGYVEPLEPPALPLHVVVQQLLALVLQEGGIGRRTWLDWYGEPYVLGEDVLSFVDELTDELLEAGYLFEDSGVLGIAEEGERRFGRRNFLDLMAVLSDPPTLKVLAGRSEIGHVPVRLLTLERRDGHVLLLAGRSWRVVEVDWRRGVVRVEPAKERGRVRWFGEGRALSFAICQAMRRVLAGQEFEDVTLSRRGSEQLRQLREDFDWVDDGDETVIREAHDDAPRWWTFAGADANVWLAVALGGLSDQAIPGDLNIRLVPEATAADVRARLGSLQPDQLRLGNNVAQGAIDRIKFAEALPEDYARLVVEARMRVDEVVRQVTSQRIRSHTVAL